MTADKRYLPIMDKSGRYIERPDLYLFARMSYADGSDEESVGQLYEAMLTQDNSKLTLTNFESLLEDKLRSDVPDRGRTASVVEALMRLFAHTGSLQPLIYAQRLAAFDYYEAERRSSPKNLERRFGES